MRIATVLLGLTAACGSKAADPPAPRATPDARVAAPSPATPTLAPDVVAAIDRVMAPVTGDRPGCAVGVVQDGALVLARGYGMADVAGGVAIDADTVFDLGSTSKQMTAAVVLQLVDEGVLSLDDPLTKHVPEVKAKRGRAITLRDLLHHTSGLPDYIELLQDDGLELTGVATEADALAALARSRPLRAPGVEHAYSNSGYFLLALVVARVTGKPFADVAHARLFAPLAMADTRVGFAAPRRATGYADREPVTSGWTQVGDGAVLSTVRDLARWTRIFHDPKPWVTAMLRPGALDDGTELDYAGGLQHGTHAGRATVSHSGSWVGFGAELVRFPDDDLAVICLCNFDDADPEAYALEIADAVLAPPG